METALLDADQELCQKIGNTIETARRVKGLSQAQLSHKIGITTVTYSKLTKGHAKLATVMAAIRILELTPSIETLISNELTHSPVQREASKNSCAKAENEW